MNDAVKVNGSGNGRSAFYRFIGGKSVSHRDTNNIFSKGNWCLLPQTFRFMPSGRAFETNNVDRRTLLRLRKMLSTKNKIDAVNDGNR